MSQLHKDIEALIVLEKSKNEIHEELVKKYEQKMIEDALKYYPEAREFKKYKNVNRILLGCICLIAVINAFNAFFLLGILGILLSMIIPLILMYYISKGKSGGYLAFMILTITGLSKSVEGLDEIFASGHKITIVIALTYFLAFIIGCILAFYLRNKLFSTSNQKEAQIT